MRFHARKAKATGKRWHSNQQNWYRRQAGRVFTFTEIVVRTFRDNREQFVANVTAANALWLRLRARAL